MPILDLFPCVGNRFPLVPMVQLTKLSGIDISSYLFSSSSARDILFLRKAQFDMLPDSVSRFIFETKGLHPPLHEVCWADFTALDFRI